MFKNIIFLLGLSVFGLKTVYGQVNRPDLAKLRTPLVLMYHDVVSSESEIDATADVTEANMKEQLEWLLSEGYTSITVQDFYLARKKLATVPEKSFLVTVDDGYRSALLKILPLIEKLKVHAAFFVNTGLTGDVETDRMNWKEISILDSSPWADVYSHSVQHSNLAQLSRKELVAEIKTSRSELEKRLGGKRPFMAYPFGIANDEVRKTAATNYFIGFSVFTPNGKPDPFFNVERFPVRSMITDLQKFKDKLATWFDGSYTW